MYPDRRASAENQRVALHSRVWDVVTERIRRDFDPDARKTISDATSCKVFQNKTGIIYKAVTNVLQNERVYSIIFYTVNISREHLKNYLNCFKTLLEKLYHRLKKLPDVSLPEADAKFCNDLTQPVLHQSAKGVKRISVSG